MLYLLHLYQSSKFIFIDFYLKEYLILIQLNYIPFYCQNSLQLYNIKINRQLSQLLSSQALSFLDFRTYPSKMISSLKKMALDQKVSKFLHSETNEQTMTSDQRFIKPGDQPQTTKYINHKCQIKKNLFDQFKENIPQSLFTIKCSTELDEKQKTINFVTEKSLNHKKKNFQYLFSSLDEQDQSKTVKIILQQKKQINELKQVIKYLQNKEKENTLYWQKEKLQQDLKDVRQQNYMMKYQINKMTQRIEDQSKCQNFQQLMHFVEENDNFKNDYINQFDETEEDTVISRMIQKVEKLSKELQFFIDLSHKFKSQAQQTKKLLQTKVSQLKTSQENVRLLQQALKNIQSKFKDQIEAHLKREDLLKSQISAYKEEYEVLKKRHFIMQSQFRKYSSDHQTREQQSMKDKHEALTKKYNLLYKSYKALYEDYINRSRQNDFVMELKDSNYKEIRTISQRINLGTDQFAQEKSVKLGKHMMVHSPQESLCECSEIRTPIENVDQNQPLPCSYPKIFLIDLIKETLMQCKDPNYQN